MSVFNPSNWSLQPREDPIEHNLRVGKAQEYPDVRVSLGPVPLSTFGGREKWWYTLGTTKERWVKLGCSVEKGSLYSDDVRKQKWREDGAWVGGLE